MFAVATLCPRRASSRPIGNVAGFNGKKIEIKDKGEVAYILSFTAGKEFEATTDGLKNTDAHLFVYDSSGAEVAKDDSPGPPEVRTEDSAKGTRVDKEVGSS